MVNVTFDAEITKDPAFDIQLNGIIAEFESEKKQAEAKAKEHGRKLKSSALLTLMNEGKLNADYIKSEFPNIVAKKSSLPSSQREVIGSIVFNAAKRTVLLKQAERAQRIEEKANAKVAEEEAKAE